MNQALNKYKPLIPLLVLVAFSVWTFVFFTFGIITLTAQQYVAIAAVSINLISFFFFRSYYKYTLALTLVFGTINLINFTPLEAHISFGLGKSNIAIQPQSLFVALLTYALNYQMINASLNRRFGVTPEQAEKYAVLEREEQIGKFKKRYEDYSDELLNNILIENKYVPAALEAARQILKKRQDNDQKEWQTKNS